MNKVKKNVMIPLSDGMVRQCLGLNTKIIKYSELKQYNTMSDIIPNINDFFICLLEEEMNSGHWTCCMNLKEGYYYFNSYGKKYDVDISVIPMCIRKILNESKPEFKRLLGDLDMDYNKTNFQGSKSMVCGRYCCLVITYCCMLGYSANDFNEFLVDKKKELKMKSYDEVVAKLCPI